MAQLHTVAAAARLRWPPGSWSSYSGSRIATGRGPVSGGSVEESSNHFDHALLRS